MTAKAAPKTKKTAPPKKTTKAAAAKSATRKSAATETQATEKTETQPAAANIVKKSSLKSALKAAAAKQRLAREKEQLQADEDKPKIAPAPMRPALRVAKRAEARRDKNQTFKVKTQIIYPAHGVGYITEIEKQEFGGISVELFVIDFEHEKMKLRVPTTKAAAAGMRNLSSPEQLAEALQLIEGKARIKRTMWSRRAQEYEAKINSGDLTSVAEVVRDLFRAADQPEQSYSERQLFEQARERLGRELAAQRGNSLEDAIAEIHKHLDRKEKVPS
ncbi:MAG: CarD family transcriptional regulator [Parvularcula sp.]